MIDNNGQNYHKIIIPIADAQELLKYQQSILFALSKLEIEKDNPEQYEHIKSLYTLLTHLRNNL
jgi:hypothetical protein